MTSQGPAGYVFAVADTAFCCWEYDHVERNLRFLSGLDAEYYWRLAEILAGHLGGESDGTASIALRAAYHRPSRPSSPCLAPTRRPQAASRPGSHVAGRRISAPSWRGCAADAPC